MSFFFTLLGSIITAIVYYFFPYPVVLAIGISYVAGVIIDAIYREIDSNFYVQTVFLVLFSLGISILTYFLDDPYIKYPVWIISTIWIFTWSYEWTGYFAYYVYDKYFSPYDNYYNRRNLTYYELVQNRNTLENIKFAIITAPYLIINFFVMFLWKEYPFVIFISPIVLFLIGLVFLIVIKVKGISIDGGFLDEIDSFEDVFKEIGRFFIRFFGGIIDFFISIGKFIRDFVRKIIRLFTSGRNYDRHFSFVSLLLAFIVLGLSFGLTYLEYHHIYSDFCNSILDKGGWLFSLSRWFPITQFVFNEWLVEINADTIINLLLFLPKLILILAALVLSALLELALSVLWLLLCGIFFLLVTIASFGFAFGLSPILSILLLVILIRSFVKEESLFNRFIAIIFFVASIVSCYFFFTLFPFQ